MKKLSILLALMLCVTIGGVYATWTYAGTDDIADAFEEAKVTITDAEFTGANGTYKIESNLVLTVDQTSATDKHAKLVFASNNSDPIFLRVTFTPNPNVASDQVKEFAVPSELYFGTTTTMEYKMDAEGNYSATGTPKAIFNFGDWASNDNFEENITWNKQPDGTFTYELNQTQLEDIIKLNYDFYLDVKAEHDAFREALTGNIVARVTDGTVNT